MRVRDRRDQGDVHRGRRSRRPRTLFADGAVCSVQNGVGNEEVIAEHVERVIRGTTFPAGRVVAPGRRRRWTPRGDTWIGPFEHRPASHGEVQRLAEAMTRGGMTTKALADARGAQWTKLIFNAASNPLGALTGLTHGRVCELPATPRADQRPGREGIAVADALGITLDSDPDALVDHAAKVAYDHRASMLQDVLAERAHRDRRAQRRASCASAREQRRADAAQRGDRGADQGARAFLGGLIMADTVDVAVIGSGHNGLVAAAYLARAGLSVEVLERNPVAGGAVASEELTEPGYTHDTFSSWHPLFKLSAAFAELGDELGVRYCETDEVTTANAGPTAR